MTPKEYGILQAFPMDDWKQVVSDSQAYKQFGNAVTTTVFTAIAEEIAKSIYAAEESEEQNMEAENKNFTGVSPIVIPSNSSLMCFANIFSVSSVTHALATIPLSRRNQIRKVCYPQKQ